MSSIEYAADVAARSTCPTRPAGAVLVTADGAVVAGYEGAPRGQGHCDVVGCYLADADWCSRAISAELNAIIEAARRGHVTVGATLYVSRTLDPATVGAIINAGITAVHTPEPMAHDLQQLLVDAGITVRP